MYYRHTGKPLPPAGGVAINWRTNVEMTKNPYREELFSFLVGQELVRCATSLGDQVTYGGQVAEEGSAMFLVYFGRTFALAIFARPGPDATTSPLVNIPILQPYSGPAEP